ncbi:MAG: YtxH domain-containing protein [Bacteroidales bacterium]|nr:YtxH domain-containing protein [Bacteroidales bacterium]
MDTGKVLISVIAGVAAGALAGVLFAPEKGSETRKRMLQRGENYAQNMKQRFYGLIESNIGKSKRRGEPQDIEFDDIQSTRVDPQYSHS